LEDAVNEQQITFLKQVIPAAQACQKATTIPAAITIAQSIFESATAAGWGTSTLFTKAKNPFGIKYEHLQNDGAGYGEFDAPTWEVENGQRVDCTLPFQSYPDLTAAFADHGRLLTTARYKPAFDLIPDWRGFAVALGPKERPTDNQHCTYSTEHSYGPRLIGAVNAYHLDDPKALAAIMAQP
jgi:flagellum-specific peptidoglycan hydrolase FlgJ